MPHEPLYPTMRDLAAELGYVQICWCHLESEMRSRLKSADVAGWDARSPVVARWRAYVERLPDAVAPPDRADHLVAVANAAGMRNLLAHAIRSVSANPWEAGSAGVVCVDLEGEEHRFSLEMIRDLSAEIQRLAGRL